MATTFSPQDVDRLIARAVRSLPGEISDPQRLQQEAATELVIDEVAEALAQRRTPDLAQIEHRLHSELDGDALPDWMVLSRLVLVLRDAFTDNAFRKAVSRLPAAGRYALYQQWAAYAASLYRDFPDEQIAGKPAVALSLLAGQTKPLRKALETELSEELHGRKRSGWWDNLRKMTVRNRPNQPQRQAQDAASRSAGGLATVSRRDGQPAPERPGFDPRQGIKRPSGSKRMGMPSQSQRPVSGERRPVQAPAEPATRLASRPAQPAPQQTRRAAPQMAPARVEAKAEPRREAPRMMPAAKAPAVHAPAAPAPVKAAAPVVQPRPTAPTYPGRAMEAAARTTRSEAPRQQQQVAPQRPRRGLRAFEASIAARFEERGLAPIAVTAAATAAIVMAERVQSGAAPDFYEVEYEVLARSGEAVAPGAVRTWTLHAFMECMRDDWFRELFHALPSQARAETVWTWAKAAAEWFDVPAKLREFWVRALSGGDPVLAAAAARAFAAKTPQLPTRPMPRMAALADERPAGFGYGEDRQMLNAAPSVPQAQPQQPHQNLRPEDFNGYGMRVSQPLPASAAQLVGHAAPQATDVLTLGEEHAAPASVSQQPAYQPGHQPGMQMQSASLSRPLSQPAPAKPKKAPAPTFRPPLTAAPRQPATRPLGSTAMPVGSQLGSNSVPPRPAGSPLFERRTPRPEGNIAIGRPLPKRSPIGAMTQAPAPRATSPAGIAPLGAAEIYYGPPGAEGSPMVPRDLARMETIGNGD